MCEYSVKFTRLTEKKLVKSVHTKVVNTHLKKGLKHII